MFVTAEAYQHWSMQTHLFQACLNCLRLHSFKQPDQANLDFFSWLANKVAFSYFNWVLDCNLLFQLEWFKIPSLCVDAHEKITGKLPTWLLFTSSPVYHICLKSFACVISLQLTVCISGHIFTADSKIKLSLYYMQ